MRDGRYFSAISVDWTAVARTSASVVMTIHAANGNRAQTVYN